MNRQWTLLLVIVLWTCEAVGTLEALAAEVSFKDSVRVPTERCSAPEYGEALERYRQCAVTNVAWMVGKWVWIEKRRHDQLLWPGGAATVDRLCVFPYADYSQPFSRPACMIAAELQTANALGELTVLPNSLPIYVTTNVLVGKGWAYWVFDYAHECDGERERLRLRAGPGNEIVFVKVCDDPGEPIQLIGEDRERNFPQWREHEAVYKKCLSSRKGK